MFKLPNNVNKIIVNYQLQNQVLFINVAKFDTR